MSRPKSPERIQADIDKAIRKERRERKRTEREAKRAARLKKQMTHESIMRNNGISKVQSGGAHLGIHDAMNYSPLLFCARCGRLSRSNEFFGGLCESCHYGKEVVDSPECLKAKQGDALEGGQVGRPIAQSGNHRKESRRQNHE